MSEMKIEWAYPNNLVSREKAERIEADIVPDGLPPYVPVVRLCDIDRRGAVCSMLHGGCIECSGRQQSETGWLGELVDGRKRNRVDD